MADRSFLLTYNLYAVKTLLLLKRLDLAVQLTALFVPGLFAFIAGQYFSVFYLYFFVGGAQVLSFLLHFATGEKQWTAPGRARYGKLLASLVGIAVFVVLLGLAWNDSIGIILIVGLIYLIITPVVAVWYFTLCFGETQRVLQNVRRQILILK
jgi:phosphatidylglycerophosphate synthase